MPASGSRAVGLNRFALIAPIRSSAKLAAPPLGVSGLSGCRSVAVGVERCCDLLECLTIHPHSRKRWHQESVRFACRLVSGTSRVLDRFTLADCSIAPGDPRARQAIPADRLVSENADAICAVGSPGRDYATMLDAMRQLPHIPLVLACWPGACPSTRRV
jgi:hypothetical protein